MKNFLRRIEAPKPERYTGDMRSRVLFVSPHPEDAQNLQRMLGPLPLSIDHVNDLDQARARLLEHAYGVILTEASLPDGGWPDVLELARQSAPDTEVIVTDPFADARIWSEVLNLGGYDMLAQPFFAPEVQRILSNACTRVPQAHAAF